jgi:hypothetical protein
MSADNLDTKPTIETVLERITALAEKMDAQSTSIKEDIAELKARLDEELSKVHARLDTELGKVNERLDEQETRFDRLEKVILQTRLEFVEFREDFREWRKKLKDVLPVA